MSVLAKLALIFVVVPLLELALLIQIGQVVGFLPTMILVVITGIMGAWLARLEGLKTLWKLRDDLALGQLPGQAIVDGMSILVGATLLLTPGVITDFVGFILLLPPTRYAMQRLVKNHFKQQIKDGIIQVAVLNNQSWTARPKDDSPWEDSGNEFN